MSLQNLLTRKTVKNFVSQPLPADIVDTALRIAHRAPTSVNSRPTRIYDITHYRDAPWLANQQSVKTAEKIWLFAWSAVEAERNIRTMLTKRFGVPDDTRLEAMLDRLFRPAPAEFCRCQTYLTAGYFTAALESAGIAGCYIGGFDRDGAKAALKDLPADVMPELVYAAGFADTANPGSHETEFVRPFEHFYFPNI